MFPAPFHDSAHSPEGSAAVSKLGIADVNQGSQEADAKSARATFGTVFDDDMRSSAIGSYRVAPAQTLPATGLAADDTELTTIHADRDDSEPLVQEMSRFAAPVGMPASVSIATDASIGTEGIGSEHLVTGATSNSASQTPWNFIDIEELGEPDGDITVGWPHDLTFRHETAPTALDQPRLTDPDGQGVRRDQGWMMVQDTNSPPVQGSGDTATPTPKGHGEIVGELDSPPQSGPTNLSSLAASLWRRSSAGAPSETAAFEVVEADGVALVESRLSQPPDLPVPSWALEHDQPKEPRGRTDFLPVGKTTPLVPAVRQNPTLPLGRAEQSNEPRLGSAPASFPRGNDRHVLGRHDLPAEKTDTFGYRGTRQGASKAVKANIESNQVIRPDQFDSHQTMVPGGAKGQEGAQPISLAAGSTSLPPPPASSPPHSVRPVALGTESFPPTVAPPPQSRQEAEGPELVIEGGAGRTALLPDRATEARARVTFSMNITEPGTEKREVPRDPLDGLLGRDSGTMLDPLPYRSQMRPVLPLPSAVLVTSQTHAQSVVAQIATVAEASKTGRVEVKLDPEELGKVTLNLITSDRAITVLIATERVETLDLMRRNIEMLGQEFRQMGYQDVSFAFREQGGEKREWDGAADRIDDASDEHVLNDSPTATRQVADGHLDIRL